MTADDQTPPAVAFHEQARRRRVELGLTQSEVAERVGCSQSAVSMFEHGYPDVLARDRLERLAEVLGLDPAGIPSGTEGGEGSPRGGRREVWRFCPQAECPSNVPYTVGGRLCFRPTFRRGTDAAPTHCPDCGEVLESRCPNPECRAAVSPGAFCPACGAPYVSAVFAPDAVPPDPAAWAENRRRLIAELRSLTSG